MRYMIVNCVTVKGTVISRTEPLLKGEWGLITAIKVRKQDAYYGNRTASHYTVVH